MIISAILPASLCRIPTRIPTLQNTKGRLRAHVVGSNVEAPYQRGDMFEKRRRLMDAWAEFCAKPDSKGVATPMKKNAQ